MVVVPVNVPEVPVIVMRKSPIVAVPLAVSVSTLVAAVGFGPNDAVNPLGRPEALKVTLPLKPGLSSTVMVDVSEVPCVIPAEPTEEPMVNVGGVMVNATAVVGLNGPFVPVIVTL